MSEPETNIGSAIGKLFVYKAVQGEGGDRLEVQGEDVIHCCRFTKVRARNELSLLRRDPRGFDQNGVPKFCPNIARLSILLYIDNQPYLAMISVTGLPCSAIWYRQADQPWRDYGRLALRRQRRQRRYKR